MKSLEVSRTLAEAEFRAGAFTISHFSDDPEGFSFKTKNSIGRTESLNFDQPLRLDESQKEQLAAGMKREQQFNDVDSLREARSAWKDASERGDDKATERREAFMRQRHEYMNRGKKIGFRAIELSGVGNNTLEADVQLVAYPTIALSTPEASPEVEALSRAGAVALVVETSDHYLVVQHRAVKKQKITQPGMSRGNDLYADIPGASVAGMVDASLSSDSERSPGTPDAVDTESLKGSILKEAGEELGVSERDFDGLRIVGVAQDHIKPHDEILFAATLNLTAEELREVSRTSSRNKNLADADFEEKFYTVEGSLGAIETFLTDIKSPLPPTHAAAMVATGYSMVLREHGQEAAHAWRDTMQEAVRQNYEMIDAMVTQHYETYPESFDQIPERYWGRDVPARDRFGYSPAYTPEEQGLPSLEDELVRTGLMPETRRVVEKAKFLHVTEENEAEAHDTLRASLEIGKPVCLTTASASAEVADRIVREGFAGLTGLIVVGGKGKEWITFNEQREPQFCNIAVNVNDAHLDEALEADRFLEFLDSRRVKVDAFEVAGNNRAAAAELVRRGRSVVGV